MNKSCPVCGGQVNKVPSPRFGAGYYECIEAGRPACDRFFREDELVNNPLASSISETWERELVAGLPIDPNELQEITDETWEKLRKLVRIKHEPPVHFITTAQAEYEAREEERVGTWTRYCAGFPAGRQDSES